MRRFPSSDDDKLLSGDLDPDDAPSELARIAGLVQAARGPGSPDELAGSELIVSQMAAVVRESRRADVAREGRPRPFGKVLSAKLIGASAAVLLSGGVAAAATGALPRPVQEVVAHGLRHIGISVPDPTLKLASAAHAASHASGPAPTSTRSRPSTSTTHVPTSANRYGLCTAYERARTAEARSIGLSKLTAAALARGETIASYCAGATPPVGSSGPSSASTHRPTNTPSATSPDGSTSHPPAGRGGQHRPTTTLQARPTSSHSNTTVPTAATGSARHKAPKNASVSPGHPTSSSNGATTTTIATTSTSTTTSPSPAAQSRGPGSATVGEGAASAHTS